MTSTVRKVASVPMRLMRKGKNQSCAIIEYTPWTAIMKPIVLVESAKPPENLKGRMGVVSMMGSLKNVGIRLSNETEWLGLC